MVNCDFLFKVLSKGMIPYSHRKMLIHSRLMIIINKINALILSWIRSIRLNNNSSKNITNKREVVQHYKCLKIRYIVIKINTNQVDKEQTKYARQLDHFFKKNLDIKNQIKRLNGTLRIL